MKRKPLPKRKVSQKKGKGNPLLLENLNELLPKHSAVKVTVLLKQLKSIGWVNWTVPHLLNACRQCGKEVKGKGNTATISH